MIEEALRKAKQIEQESVGKLSKNQLKLIVSLIDYTTLNDDDSIQSVSKWIDDSKKMMLEANCYCGGWCTYPEFVQLLNEKRGDFPTSIAVVSGNFPSGKALSQVKVDESALSEALGAEEIDVVINKGWAKENNFAKIEKELSLIKGALASAHLKVIMETGMLDVEQIEAVSKAAIRAGANFIKTSTGKTEKGASLEAIAIMCYAVKEHYLATGMKVGIKPSGGISDPQVAWQYILLVKSILGEDWMNNKLFRIGASRLLTNTLNQLKD